VATVVAPPKPAAPVEKPKTEPLPPASVRARSSWCRIVRDFYAGCHMLCWALSLLALMWASLLLHAVADTWAWQVI